MVKLMIYGANGYTGSLISDEAKKVGLDLVLAGRTEASLRANATALDTSYRVFGLEDPSLIDSSLHGIKVLQNCAGPFSRTAEPLIEACIRNGIHYLDTSAELISHEIAERKDREAKNANVILLPGCGGSVTLLGCLVRRALEAIGDRQLVESMDLALHVSGAMSGGSARTAEAGLGAGLLQRRDGCLVSQGAACNAQCGFNDGRGDVDCFLVTMPDLITIHKFLGVQNLRTFAHASGSAFSTGNRDTVPTGPTSEERDANPYDAAVTVTTKDGSVRRFVLHSINGYSFTAMASVEAARRILKGQYLPGFEMSPTLFGADFAESGLGTKARSVIVLS
jgi:short subunit dehydrogenase-like uncharacterized protein